MRIVYAFFSLLSVLVSTVETSAQAPESGLGFETCIRSEPNSGRFGATPILAGPDDAYPWRDLPGFGGENMVLYFACEETPVGF